MSIATTICGIYTKIINSKTKTMKIRVYCNSIRVSVPNNMSYYMHYNDIVKFVSDNIEWIREEQKKLNEENKFPVHEYTDGEEVYLFGKKYILCIEEGKNGAFVSDDKIILTLKDNGGKRKRCKLLYELYRKMLKEKIEILMPIWEEKTGLFANGFRIIDMNNSWGICHRETKNISYSLNLAKMPVECIEYIILHELSHIEIPNHGKDFLALVEKYMPDWRNVKTRLDFECMHMH